MGCQQHSTPDVDRSWCSWEGRVTSSLALTSWPAGPAPFCIFHQAMKIHPQLHIVLPTQRGQMHFSSSSLWKATPFAPQP